MLTKTDDANGNTSITVGAELGDARNLPFLNTPVGKDVSFPERVLTMMPRARQCERLEVDQSLKSSFSCCNVNK